MAATKVLMGFALAAITAVTIAGTTITWYDGPINERQGFIESQISGLAGEATIGQTGDSQEAEEEFRALVAFNMLAASQCELIELVHLEQDELDDEDISQDFIDTVPERHGEDINSLADTDESSFYVWFDSFEHLERTDFHAECYALDIDFDPSEVVADTVESMPIIGTPVSVARSIDDSIDNYWGDDAPFENQDLSMEGNVGSVDFDTETSFVIQDPRLLGMRIGGATSGSPRLQRGHRAALFMPGNIDADQFLRSMQDDLNTVGGSTSVSSLESEDDWGSSLISGDFDDYSIWSGTEAPGNVHFRWDAGAYDVKEHSNDGLAREDGRVYGPEEFFWMERIRMKNIPTISQVTLQDRHPSQSFHPSVLLDEFIANSVYVVCEGATGVIQTNAGEDMRYGGDTESDDDPVWRDVVYPKVETDMIFDDCMDFESNIYPLGRLESSGRESHGTFTHRHDQELPYDLEDGPSNNVCQIGEDVYDHSYGLVRAESEGDVFVPDNNYRLYMGENEYFELECSLVERSITDFGEALEHSEGEWGQDVRFYNLEYVFKEEVPSTPRSYDITRFYGEEESGTWDDTNNQVDLDFSQAVAYNVERFDEDTSYFIEFELDIDEEVGSDGWSIVFQSYGEDQLQVASEGSGSYVHNTDTGNSVGVQSIQNQEKFFVMLSPNSQEQNTDVVVATDGGMSGADSAAEISSNPEEFTNHPGMQGMEMAYHVESVAFQDYQDFGFISNTDNIKITDIEARGQPTVKD